MTAREIAALFEDLELRLIASLKRNLARHKAEEKDEGFDWPAWQAEKLHSLQRSGVKTSRSWLNIPTRSMRRHAR